ncbi:amino acid adenylation domain-containing protein [Massilia sp. PAMC28688]|uniref:non-ribosomal peptide synthetase n=1 Tax=Massilia sp. PAMC28688 TaxID=2861283 RepID=UPI001C639254|nr:non-ribosomal peptide synthetase [Massilia sp. PAMC28688]QYF93460.1 amino acid adenylation domain-containing protein [Massilia sp. PAMC28688]
MNPTIDCGSGREVSQAEGRQYWRATLADALPLLAFPTDFARPARIDGRSAGVLLPLEPAHAARVRGLCAAHGISTEQLFLALYQVFLQRYAGQTDIVVGLRQAWSGEPVPLRQQLDATLPFLELAAHNVRALEQAHSYGAPPPELTAPDAAASHAPVFQHLYSFAQVAGQGADAIGLFDTMFTVTDDGTALAAELRYSSALFAPDSAARWAANLVTLLDAACATPGGAVGELDLLHADEKAFIAASLDRSTAAFVPRFSSVHAGFEQQAAATPEAIALRCGSASLTYAQLDARANAIAQYLHLQGVAAGELVGICTARTTDMVAAVIGVLKLGAAYVPMDTKYPALRLAAIADEARLKLVVCDERGRGLFGAGVRAVVLAEIADAAPTFGTAPVDEETLCHVIFTSGSTGTPKGVMARHRNVLAFLEWIYATYSREELDVVLCCSSLCFDLTVFELWGPLTVGGTVVLVDNPASLVQQDVPGLTLVNTVPTALRLIVDELALPRTVKAVNVCGEPLDAQLVNDLFHHYPDVVFYNTYGPTEDTAYSTFFKMTGPREEDPPIGAPIVHEYGRVVDGHGMQVPVGAVGDLLIGGAGVAKGYLFKPEATAARFTAATDYAGRPAMQYRTGDFVRLRADGQLHFVGRRDDQVKLRGFRIDLGDVVHAIGQIPGVTDARVLVKRHKTGDVLVTYISHSAMAPGSRSDAALQAEVEQEARERLPAFMVPSYFVLFDKLPLNDNGKVDRHALAAIDFDPQAVATPPAFMSDDERTLAAIWKPILACERVGRDDDFFDLGGNSLLAVRMVARLNRAFGSELPAQIVFEHRTVAALAAHARAATGAALPPLERVDLAQGVSPTYPQLAMLMDAHKTSFNLCHAMHIDGPLDENALRGSLRALLARHDALRSRFVMGEGGARMLIDPEAADILAVRVLEGGAGAVRAAVEAEWNQPFDLQQGLPIRALLLRVAPERHVFVLSVHHVVTDEWSANIIKSDLAALYRAALDPSLPEPAFLPIRFGDYASWQGKLHTTAQFGQHLAYWAGEFAQLRSAGGAYPAPVAAAEDEGCAMRFRQWTPPPQAQAALAGLGARHGCTPYVIYLAAMQLALAAYSGLEQQLVWTPVASRTRPELEESVGMYTNLTAILAQAGSGQRLDAFLQQVDAKVAQARRHSDVSALTALMQDPGLMPMRPMVGLNYIDLPNECCWQFEGTQVLPIPLQLEHEADLCALELTVRVVDGVAQLTVAYNTAQFNGAQVSRLGQSLWHAMDALWTRPADSVGELLVALAAGAELAAAP